MDLQFTAEHRMSPQQQSMLARVAIIVLAIVVVIITLTLVLTRDRREIRLRPGESRRGTQERCNTSACHQFASLLKGTISGSPCRDFYDYVCSGWLRNPTFRSTRDMQARTLVREASKSLKLLADSLTTPMKDPAGATSVAAIKAAKLYGSCLVASKRQDIEVLAAFLRDVGLGFSTPVQAPMTLAIELDLYYNLKTLFDLHRHPTWKSADGHHVLALSKRTDLDVWVQERNGMERSKSYSDFVESRVSHVVALENSTSAKSDAVIKDNVRRIIDTESVILSLWEALPSEDPARFYKMTPLPLRDNATSWSNNVTEAAVGNPSMLAFQDSLGTRMSNRNLGLYITWEVVRHLGPLADKR
ncbi:unnamed protein product [Ixodes pacificus]